MDDLTGERRASDQTERGGDEISGSSGLPGAVPETGRKPRGGTRRPAAPPAAYGVTPTAPAATDDDSPRSGGHDPAEGGSVARDASGRSGDDSRRRGWFWHWNSIVTQYAPLVGLKGIGLLNSYTVWTDRRDESPHRGYAFPSQQAEADFYGEDRSELITINKILVALDLIEIRKEMLTRVDAQGRRWKVPHNLYRVKDRPDGMRLRAVDVLRVVELAERDADVYRYVRRIFSTRFSPIDRDNVWHEILAELPGHPAWQALRQRTAEQEARASARTRAGHDTRAGKTPSVRSSAKITNGHIQDRSLSQGERGDVIATRQVGTVAPGNDGRQVDAISVAGGSNGSSRDVAASNEGLEAGETGIAAAGNQAQAGDVGQSNTTYDQSDGTTTTTTTRSPGGAGTDARRQPANGAGAQDVADREAAGGLPGSSASVWPPMAPAGLGIDSPVATRVEQSLPRPDSLGTVRERHAARPEGIACAPGVAGSDLASELDDSGSEGLFPAPPMVGAPHSTSAAGPGQPPAEPAGLGLGRHGQWAGPAGGLVVESVPAPAATGDIGSGAGADPAGPQRRGAGDRASGEDAERGLADPSGYGPVVDPSPLVVSAFEAANDRRARPLERQLLAELERDADSAARAAGASGADWVVAAVREAVASGSSFVAPKRIREIITRWAAEYSAQSRAAAPGGAAAGPPAGGAQRGQSGLVGNGDLMPGTPPGASVAAEPVAGAGPRPGPAAVRLPGGRSGTRVWSEVLDDLRRALEGHTFERLLAGSAILRYREGRVEVRVASQAAAEKLSAEYRPLVERHLEARVGCPVAARFEVDPAALVAEELAHQAAEPVTAPAAALSVRRSDLDTGRQLWRAILAEIEAVLASDDRERLAEVVPLGQSPSGALILAAPTQHARRLLEARYRDEIERAFSSLLGTRISIETVSPDAWSISPEP